LKLIFSEVIFKIAEIFLWEKLATDKAPNIEDYCTDPPSQIIVLKPFELVDVL